MSSLRPVVLACFLIDTLTFVAPMVHVLLATKAGHRLVRELGPVAPSVLDPLAPVEGAALHCAASLRSVGFARENHCSGLRSMPSFFRSEIIRCAWGLCSCPSAFRPEWMASV